MTQKRKWMLRGVGFAVFLLAMVATWAGLHATELRAKYAARKLISATTDEDRATWASTLAGYGEPGERELIAILQDGDDPARTATVVALEKHLNTFPGGDAQVIALSGTILEAFPQSNESGKRAVLQLIPTILKQTGRVHALRCRGAVAEGVKAAEFDTRLAAVRLAIHPEIRLRTELMPLLSSSEPQMRGAALFAMTLGDKESTVSDEELFHWLHDSDATVRKICHDALVARERSEVEISLGRRLTAPDPTERLKLILDLRYDEVVTDPEPWLERLSRDPEPAVRAGAARVAVEIASDRSQHCPQWVSRIADTDPHPTVRFVVAYYRTQPSRDQAPIRPVAAP